MNTDITLNVSEIQRFCMHDGAGIRTTVFLQGCPLRCAWCHNPEMQNRKRELLFYADKCLSCGQCAICPQKAHVFSGTHKILRQNCNACGACVHACPTKALMLCGRDYTIEELLLILEKDRAFYGTTGGITLSGGEPFMQGQRVPKLLRVCKEKGFSTAVETCGYGDAACIAEAIPYTDLFLWDIKDTDAIRHKRYTGVSNEKILKNLKEADANGAKTRLRCILVNGVNTDEAHYQVIGQLVSSLKHCEGVEWIPYHAYAGTKSLFIGRADSGNKSWIPTEVQLEHAKYVLREMNLPVF